MNTDEIDKKEIKKKPSLILKSVLTDATEINAVLPKLMHTLTKVDLKTEESKLNETSITDDNGERIILVGDAKDIKK